jgi:hypothetical protein
VVACLKSVQSIGVKSCSQGDGRGGGRGAAGSETKWASRLAGVDGIP